MQKMKRKTSTCPYQLELALSFEAEAVQASDPVTTDMPAIPVDAPSDTAADLPAEPAAEPEANTRQPHCWCDDGWTARVIKNDEGDGWAVAMTRDGEAEPAFVGPWTMGRDKKNPRPLDAVAFATLVKSASEVRRRHEQQMHALLHKQVTVSVDAAPVTVTLDIEPDDEHAYATLAAYDEAGTRLAQVRVAPTFKLSKASAEAWIENAFRRP